MREDFPLPTLPTTAMRAPSGTRRLMSRSTTGPSPESVPHVNDACSRVSWSETDSSWPIWGKEDLNVSSINCLPVPYSRKLSLIPHLRTPRSFSHLGLVDLLLVEVSADPADGDGALDERGDPVRQQEQRTPQSVEQRQRRESHLY